MVVRLAPFQSSLIECDDDLDDPDKYLTANRENWCGVTKILDSRISSSRTCTITCIRVINSMLYEIRWLSFECFGLRAWYSEVAES